MLIHLIIPHTSDLLQYLNRQIPDAKLLSRFTTGHPNIQAVVKPLMQRTLPVLAPLQAPGLLQFVLRLEWQPPPASEGHWPRWKCCVQHLVGCELRNSPFSPEFDTIQRTPYDRVSFVTDDLKMNMQCAIFTKLKATVTQLVNRFRLVKETSTAGRPRKINPIDAMTLSLYRHQSTRATKRSVYEDFKHSLRCSYKTLVVSRNQAAILCARILLLILHWGRKYQHEVKYTDATDIPVCLKKNADSHKTMAGLAKLGRSTKGWFYGIKLTITRDKEGRLLAVLFTRANKNDREICRKINKDIYGTIILDAGYVSKQKEQ